MVTSDAEKLKTIAALAIRPDTAEEAWIALMHICRILHEEIDRQKQQRDSTLAAYVAERAAYFDAGKPEGWEGEA
jgi:hypothetical protein